MLRTKVLKIIEKSKSFLDQAAEKPWNYCYGKGNFSRAKILTFARTALISVNLLKKSMQVEINDFFETIDCVEQACTKSAFCQARQQIRPIFFCKWNKNLVDSFYDVAGDSEKRWRGLKLEAVDGMKVYLPQTEDIYDAFGGQENQFGKTAMAMTVCSYDVLNDLITEGYIGSYKTSEQYFACRLLANASTDTLRIYDRNFPSFELIYGHSRLDIPMLMRVKADFNNRVKAFVGSGERMAIVQFTATKTAIDAFSFRGIILPKDATVTVRLVRIELSSGELEILITTLMNEELTVEDFKELYNLRWSEEVCFDRLKNKIQLEVFSSKSAHGIEQEFYTALFICNLQSIIVKGCQEEIDQISERRELDYSVNRNTTIGDIKRYLPKLFLSEEPEKILRILFNLFVRDPVPIKPGRSFERKKKKRKTRGRFYTERAYKRAI